MGGTGKTRAAVEYAWAYREHYTALLFVIADDPKALSGNLAALSVHLLLRHSPDRDAAEYVRRQAVLDWLNENPGWLLILDNIDTGAALTEAETLIGQLTGGHVVMTSRLANFPGAIAPLELDVLRPKDAADFLLARTSKLRRAAADDKATARQLALDLGCLALALEHAGAYIVWRKESLRSYRELWESNRETVLNWSDPTVTHYPRAIAVTWQTSVAQLTDPARHLLERLAWLALDPVPEFLLDVPIPEAAGGNLRDALADLAAYSLASRDAVQPQFSVHRLVQEVTRNSLDAAGKAQLRRLETLGWIDAAFEGDPTDLHTWPRLDPLVTHARAIIGDADAAETTEPTSRLVGRFAVFSLTKSVVAEGEQLMRRALTVAEESLEPQYSNLTLRLSNIRRFLQDINRFIDAAPVMLRALTIDEKSFGTNNTEVMLRLQMLQQLLKDTDQLVDAAALKLRDLALDQKSFTPGDPKEALRLDTIGGLLKATELLAGFFEAMGKDETEIRTAIEAVTAKMR
jgi:hypothetical protein